MAWMIVSDSSCEIRELKNPAPGVQFALVPFKIRVGEREYVDLATLNTQQMLQAMTDYNGASTTACPSPEEWAEYFLQADNCIALTISSNLSGSYNAAVAARTMVLEEHPEKKILHSGHPPAAPVRWPVRPSWPISLSARARHLRTSAFALEKLRRKHPHPVFPGQL